MRREEFQQETLREQAILLAAALAIAPLRSNAADLVVWCEKGFYPEEDEAIAETLPHSSRRAPTKASSTSHRKVQ